MLRAERAVIETGTAGPRAAGPGTHGVRVGLPRAYRPRPRVIAAPGGASALERVRALTGAGAATAEAERRIAVAADPEQAAALILDALDRWGYGLPDGVAR